jgi:hypothetical protein
MSLRCWFDPQYTSRVRVSQHIDEFVGSLSHVSDALAQLAQERFASQFFHLFVEENPFQMTGPGNFTRAKSTNEHVTLPLGQL